MSSRPALVRPFDDVQLLEQLRSAPQLFERLQTLHGSEFAIQKELRRDYPDELVRGAMLLTQLRQRARSKFERAESMWFDREGLEQATAEPVARSKAQRFAGAAKPVFDLCSGIGADSLALAAVGQVVAVDRRPAAGLMSRWNAEVYGVAERIETRTADATSLDLSGCLVHIDPDRRPTGARTLRIEDHEPGLEFLQQLATAGRGGAIKLSPASNFGGKFPDAEIELISLYGECKEATVWFGDLRTSTDWRATVLPQGATLAGDPWTARADVASLGKYLFDPDPAVVRAGLVDVLAEANQLLRLDPAEEYLTADNPVQTPFAQMFEVIEDLSNNDREIRNWFRRADCGQVEIKCRRIPVSADKVRQKLPLSGSLPLVLIFARIAGRARAVVCRRVGSRAESLSSIPD